LNIYFSNIYTYSYIYLYINNIYINIYNIHIYIFIYIELSSVCPSSVRGCGLASVDTGVNLRPVCWASRTGSCVGEPEGPGSGSRPDVLLAAGSGRVSGRNFIFKNVAKRQMTLWFSYKGLSLYGGLRGTFQTLNSFIWDFRACKPTWCFFLWWVVPLKGLCHHGDDEVQVTWLKCLKYDRWCQSAVSTLV